MLTDINFSIARRDCVAIVGPNGAGKSTLMLAMLGLLPVNQGRISLLGRPLNRFGGRKSIAREIAYVAQQYEGFAGFTVEDMVATGRYAYQWALALHSPSDRRSAPFSGLIADR